MSLADIAASVGRRSSTSAADAVDPLTFIETEWGLGLRLFPVQRVIIKAHYGMALDDNALDVPLDREVTQIPHGIIVSRIFKVNYKNLVAVIDTVFDHRITVTGC